MVENEAEMAGDEAYAVYIDRIARVAHEVNRAYCNAYGDASTPPWESASHNQQASLRAGVRAHLAKPDITPEQSHELWLERKVLEGWVYGEHKDETEKTHPCMLPYRELPREQRVKDYLFKAVVNALK